MSWKRLVLLNFRHHVHTEIEFQPGLTGIIGENGVGKTTIIEGVAWALCGSQAALTTNDDIPYDGMAPGGQCEVRFTFDLPGAGDMQLFEVVRGIGYASLSVGGRVVVSGPDAVTKYIADMRGQTYQEWANSVLVMQGGLDWMSGKKRAERERFLSDQIGYGAIKPSQQKVRDRAKSLSDQIGLLKGIIEADSGEEVDPVTEGKLSDAKLAMDQAEAARKEYGQAADDSLEELTKLEASRDEHQGRVGALAKANVTLETVKEQIPKEEKKKIKITWDGPTLREALDRDTEAKEHARRDIEVTERDHRLSALLWQVAVDERRSSDSTAGVAVAERDRLLGEVTALEELGLEAECPTCHQDLARGYDDAVKLVAGLCAVAQEEARVATTALEETEGEVSNLHRDMEDFKEQLDERRERLVSIGGAIDQTNRSIEALGRQQESNVAVEQEITALHVRIAVLQDEANNAGTRITELGFDEDGYQRLRARYSQLRTEASGAAQTSIDTTHHHNTLRTQFNAAQAKQEALQANRVRVLTLKEERMVCQETGRMFTEMRSALNDRIRPDISALATELIVDMSNGRYTELYLNDDYMPVLVSDGKDNRLNSGGERAIANIALRLAISQLIADRSQASLDTVVFDEVFGSLSEARRPALAEVLKRITSTRFEQAIVVLHEPSVRNFMDHVIEVRLNENKVAVVSCSRDLASGVVGP